MRRQPQFSLVAQAWGVVSNKASHKESMSETAGTARKIAECQIHFRAVPVSMKKKYEDDSMTKKHKQIAIAAALIMITICAVFLLNKCSGGPPDNTLLSVASGEPWDNENVNGNGNSEESQGISAFPATPSCMQAKTSPMSRWSIPGKHGVFSIRHICWRKINHETELIKPGGMLRWDAHSVFESGDYAIEIKILTYDIDSQVECNGATMPATLHVTV
jgi:hypothetical protein